MTSTVDEARAVYVILHYFSKALIVSHSVFVAKLRRRGLDKWTKSGVKNFLDHWARSKSDGQGIGI